MNGPGPVLIRQKRYGFDGQEVLAWKLCLMTVCEHDD